MRPPSKRIMTTKQTYQLLAPASSKGCGVRVASLPAFRKIFTAFLQASPP